MMTIAEALALGLRHHQAGALAHAEQVYRQVLQVDPDNAEALHLLAALACQVGRFAQAVELNRQALAGNPTRASTYFNLASAYHALGQREAAVGCYRQAICLRPDYAEACYNLGNLLRELGRLEEAVASYRETVRLLPGDHHARNNLGGALRELGRLDEAVACFREVVRLRPDLPEAHHNLGAALGEQRKPELAEACYRQALMLQPNYREAHCSLGNALADQGRLPEAEACYREALRLEPGDADSYHGLGVVLADLGRLAEADACYGEALRLRPGFAEAHCNRGQLRLMQGQWEQGWRDYEWRWRIKSFAPDGAGLPPWDGRPLNGRTILLHAEQGVGDTIQFIRFAPLVKERGGRVIVECAPALVSLLANAAGIERLIPRGTALPPFDVHVPLMTLPALLGTRLATVPAEVPYLAVDPDRVARWREVLADMPPGLRVGVVWQGNPEHRNDRRRSVPLTQLEPLARVPGVRLISLQVGTGAEQLSAVGQRWPITDLGNRFDRSSFADAAAVLCGLDLLVSVDTALVHLAGALGRPVWVALPFAADWRWLREREDSPWYPTARLFRQGQAGQWTEVVDRMTSALGDWAVRHEGLPNAS
jgi:tetratricopeptide (TPR) repeat protein